MVNAADALIMYYAFTQRALLGDGDAAADGFAHWRAALLGALVPRAHWQAGDTADDAFSAAPCAPPTRWRCRNPPASGASHKALG